MNSIDSTPQALVLDTNAVLGWLLFRDPRMQPIAAAVIGHDLTWFATAAMRIELQRVIARPSLARYSPDCEHILTEFDRHAREAPSPTPSGLRCRDAGDQMFIDLACDRRPAWLVTHDRDLLVLARRARALGVYVRAPEVTEPPFFMSRLA